MSPETGAIVVALIVAVVGPQVTDWVRDRRTRAALARVAKLAAVQEERMQETAAQTAGKLDEIKEQGDVIHGIVNSAHTAAMQSDLLSTRRSLVLLRRVIADGEDRGRPPTLDELAEVKKTEAKIAELSATIADRLAPPTGEAP